MNTFKNGGSSVTGDKTDKATTKVTDNEPPVTGPKAGIFMILWDCRV